MEEGSSGVIFVAIVFGAFSSFVTLRRVWLYFKRGVYATSAMEEAILMWAKRVKGKKAAHQRQRQLQDTKRMKLFVLWNAIIGIAGLFLTVIAILIWVANTMF